MTVIDLEKIGIIGGGVNAAFLCLEAKKKGIQTTIVDPDMYCPASHIADEHLVSPLNEEALLKLIHRTDAIVFTKRLDKLTDYRSILQEDIRVYPKLEVLEILSSRERFLWKMEQNDIPVMPYKRLQDKIQVLEALKDIHFPVNVTRHYNKPSNGKDHDRMMLLSEEDIVDLLMEVEEDIHYWLIEEIALNVLDISIGVTVDMKNKIYVYSVTEDIYSNGEWVQSYVPARITKTLHNKAIALAKKTIKALGGVGTFTVKLGGTKDKDLYVREVLPYPVNNAVYTDESCSISQYDHLLRVMLGLTLFPSALDGVIFTHLENGTELARFENMNGVLEKLGTNVYSFRGKASGDNVLLYTFKADTWEDLGKIIDI